MSEGRSVPRETVIQVLRTVLPGLGVSVNVSKKKFVLLVHNDIPEVHPLPANVPEKQLEYFERKFGIKIEFFFNPEMCVKGPTTKN